MSRPGAFLDHAIAYAARGWPVFPLRPRDKVPLIAKAAGGNGCHDATTDPDRIRKWWTSEPRANIGLACGVAFWAFDLEFAGTLASDEPDGADTLLALRRRFGPLPPTVRQLTGSLGWHYLFKADPRIRNGVKPLPGADTRSAGGYIAAPPSVHPSGRCYEWIAGPDEAEIATAPEWLVAMLEPVELPQPAPPHRRPVRAGNVSRYATAALERACDRISGAAPGQQCEVLDHEAYAIGRLIAGGVVPKAEAEPALVAAGCRMRSQAGRRPWTHREVAWHVGHALTAGGRNPRTPEARP